MSVKHGDLYELGDHYLLCGDATKKDEAMRLINARTIDLILTDPPYGVAYVESKENFTQSVAKAKVIQGDQIQTEEQYRWFTNGWLSQAKRHMAKKNAVYIFNSDKMLFSLREGMEQAGFKFAQLLIWAKTHAVIGRMDYLPQHELIAYGWYGTHEFHKSKDKSILVYPKPNKSKWHPTTKPIGLLRRIILNSTELGDTVYDPFAGSGSTLFACEQTGRKCLSIEIEPEYCENIVMLWEKLTKKKANLI